RMADRIGDSIQPEPPAPAVNLMAQATLEELATTDGDGRPRTPVQTGAQGFVRVPDGGRPALAARPGAGDPPAGNLAPSRHAQLPVPDFTTRRRPRLNRRVEQWLEGDLVIGAEEVYANCPKYIQRRAPTLPLGSPPGLPALRSRSLTEAQRRWL